MPAKKQDSTRYPVLYYTLTPGDYGFDQGYRFMVEQVDKDRHFFKTSMGEHGAETFMQTHGMQMVPTAQMTEARQALGIK